jgi:hypothetical protein
VEKKNKEGEIGCHKTPARTKTPLKTTHNTKVPPINVTPTTNGRSKTQRDPNNNINYHLCKKKY